MKLYLIKYAFLLLLLKAASPLRAQQLEIHQLNVGHGDAAIIVSKFQRASGGDSINKVMIIDFGKISSRDLVGEYLDAQFNYSGPVQYAIVTHYDMDHYKGYDVFCQEYLKRTGNKVENLYIPGGLVKSGRSYTYPKTGTHPTASDWLPKLPSSAFYSKKANLTHFLKYAADSKYTNSLVQLSDEKRLNIDFVFDVIEGVPVKMTALAGVQYVRGKKERVFSESGSANNDCLAWVLEYGQFRFYTGGDLGGETGSSYIDHETDVAAYLASESSFDAYPTATARKDVRARGHVCVAKIGHHGSKESSNDTFLKKTNPTAWIVSCGGSFDHPSYEVVQRMKNVDAIPLSKDGIRAVLATSIPYTDPRAWYVQAFSNKRKYWMGVNDQDARSHGGLNIGTCVISVKPSALVNGTGTRGAVAVPITERSIFSVEYNDAKYRYFQDFDCHYIK